jgi:hypothetical protein
VLTRSENCKAYNKPRNNARTSKYRGVHYNDANDYWVCEVHNPRITQYHKTEIEAAKAWNKLAAANGYAAEALNQID